MAAQTGQCWPTAPRSPGVSPVSEVWYQHTLKCREHDTYRGREPPGGSLNPPPLAPEARAPLVSEGGPG